MGALRFAVRFIGRSINLGAHLLNHLQKQSPGIRAGRANDNDDDDDDESVYPPFPLSFPIFFLPPIGSVFFVLRYLQIPESSLLYPSGPDSMPFTVVTLVCTCTTYLVIMLNAGYPSFQLLFVKLVSLSFRAWYITKLSS